VVWEGAGRPRPLPDPARPLATEMAAIRETGDASHARPNTATTPAKPRLTRLRSFRDDSYEGLAQLFLGACTEPDVEQIIFLEVPAVLGWEAWRDLAGRYGLGLIQLALQSAGQDNGRSPPDNVHGRT
jgi:hypothetical protein